MSGDAVACPLCGALQKDLWEHDFGSREELTASCGTCGADYLLGRHVTVTYAVRRPAACRGAAACNGCLVCLPGFSPDMIAEARSANRAVGWKKP